MALASMLTYNDLNGEEVRHVIENRVQQFFNEVTYFQRHMTMPRVRITTQVRMEVWADQPSPDVIPLNDRFDVVVERSQEPMETISAEAVDSTSPNDGNPPDEVREMHGLPISTPTRGARSIGAHIGVADSFSEPTPPMLPGLTVTRTGDRADSIARYATVAIIDAGPAGLAHGEMRRESFSLNRGVPVKVRPA